MRDSTLIVGIIFMTIGFVMLLSCLMIGVEHAEKNDTDFIRDPWTTLLISGAVMLITSVFTLNYIESNSHNWENEEWY